MGCGGRDCRTNTAWGAANQEDQDDEHDDDEQAGFAHHQHQPQTRSWGYLQKLSRNTNTLYLFHLLFFSLF